MGETVSFASNGDTAEGYLARPASGSGPGVMVMQEWWGLVPQIKLVCDRFAAEGFVAFAPDLYRGDIAEHTEMDKAAHLMSTLPMDRAARDMGGAVDFLLGLPDSAGRQGRCRRLLHGRHARAVGRRRSRATRSARPPPTTARRSVRVRPDWSGLTAVVRGHFAANDDFFPPDAVKALEADLQGHGQGRRVRRSPRRGSRVHERRRTCSVPTTPVSRRGAGPTRWRSCEHTSADRPEPDGVSGLSDGIVREPSPRQAPSARNMAGGISSRPWARSCVRSMLIRSRGSRSGQRSHGPGGIAPATQ